MTEPESIILRQLRQLDVKLDRVQSTLDDHTQRLLRMERRLLERDGDALRQDESIARLDQRVARIERRLELAEEAGS